MDQTGLINSIVEAVEAIARGRQGFATRGQESEGRILYEEGIALAIAVFRQAGTEADPRIIALVEEAFLRQELFFCDASEYQRA